MTNSVLTLSGNSAHKSKALIMALFQDEAYVNKPQYRDLFMDGDTCLVKGVCFMGTPFLGSGHANLLAPFVKAVKGLNIFSATNDKFLGSLKENNQSIEVPTIVHRFKSIAKEKKIRLLIGCEQIPVAGSELVWLLHPCPGTHDCCHPQPRHFIITCRTLTRVLHSIDRHL